LIAVTVPAHNEVRFIEKAVEALLRATASFEDEFRIVIAEDGSTDGTDRIAQTLADRNSRIVHIHADRKLGRGLALKNAWNQIDADIYVYVDCDLATDMKYYPRLINLAKQGYDLVTGSRYKKGAKVQRPTLRDFASKIYNTTVRLMFKTQVFDHQAGFKAFSKRLVANLLDQCKSTDWFWDTEIIIRARQEGYRCTEFPVEWEERRRKKTPIARLAKDIYVHGKGLLRMRTRGERVQQY